MRFKKETWKEVIELLIASEGMSNDAEKVEIWARFENGRFVYYVDVI